MFSACGERTARITLLSEELMESWTIPVSERTGYDDSIPQRRLIDMWTMGQPIGKISEKDGECTGLYEGKNIRTDEAYNDTPAERSAGVLL
jgi:hypothetical protein